VGLLVAVAGLISCGSVSSTHHDGGETGGTSGSAGGATASGGASGAGGVTGGSGGVSGAGGVTAGAGGATGTGVLLRGGLSTLGPAPAQTGAIRITHQRLQAGPTCAGNVCVSGGLAP
jgi:hypothetical protein